MDKHNLSSHTQVHTHISTYIRVRFIKLDVCETVHRYNNDVGNQQDATDSVY